MTDTSDPAPKTSDSYAIVAQACAMAIQDAVAYLRGIETIASSTIGIAQERLLNASPGPDPAKAMTAAQESIATAIEQLNSVVAAATKTLAEFPRD